jgi:hypothetical protein
MSIQAEAPREDVAPPSQPRRSRRLRSAVPLVILLVLLAELTVRAAAPTLREPLLWPDWETANKVAAIDALGARGGASVVFVGSSMVNRGLDPALATKLLKAKRPVFNAALSGADLRTIDLWTREVVVPRLHPKIVILGFNSNELNDHWEGQTQLYAKMLRSTYGKRLAGTGGVLATMDAWLADHSYLMRYRTVLRRPVDALIGHDKAKDQVAVDPLGEFLRQARFHARPYTAGTPRNFAVWKEVFRDYRAGGKQLVAMDRLVNDLKAKGIRVVLVRMPVTKDVIPLHPRGQVDRERFAEVLAAFLAGHPVRFIDAEPAIGGSPMLFVDPLHLNAEGQRKTTAYVVRSLQKPM